MKKMIAATAAICFLAMPAIAGDVELEALMLDVDTVDVAHGDDWAFKGSIAYTDIDEALADVDGTNVSFAVSRRITSNLSGGLGYATTFEDSFDSYQVKGWVTYRVPSVTALK